MTTSKFEELEVYQLAEKLSDMIWNIVIKKDSLPRRTVGVQYVNASDSVGANIEEGYGKGSYVDRSRFAKKYQEDRYLKRDIGQINLIAEN